MAVPKALLASTHLKIEIEIKILPRKVEKTRLKTHPAPTKRTATPQKKAQTQTTLKRSGCPLGPCQTSQTRSSTATLSTERPTSCTNNRMTPPHLPEAMSI